jgi:hypothetical protein
MEKKAHQSSDEISIQDLIQKLKSIWKFLLSKWIKILIVGCIGATFGVGYAYLQPIKYVAKLSFVVEDAKSGSGGLASLAGQFGFDLGGAGGGGVFSGDNILLFLKSDGLIRETLMTFYDKNETTTLADQYAQVTKLKQKWSKNNEVGNIDFSKFKAVEFQRKEDSLMQYIVRRIKKADLYVLKPDKKASFVEVEVSSVDELFSKLFVERLVDIATEKYVASKTNSKAVNVDKLQKKVDSLASILNNKTYVAANNQQTLVDANPALRTAPIASEISTREKTMAATIFAEAVKNLEFSKTLLSQETPIIQIVDQSTLPLPIYRISKLNSLLLGGLLSTFFFILFLIIKKWYNSHL